MSIKDTLALHKNKIIAGVVALGLVGVGAAAFISQQDRPALLTSENEEYYQNNLYEDAYDWYRAVCPGFDSALTANQDLSLAVENSISETPQEQLDARINTVNTIADDIESGAQLVADADAPSQVPRPGDLPSDYNDAKDLIVDDLHGVSQQMRDTVDEVSADGADVDLTNTEDTSAAELISDATERLNDSVSEGARTVKTTMEETVQTAVLPNDLTRDALAKTSECAEIFSQSPLEDDEVADSVVDLWEQTRKASYGISEAMQGFNAVSNAEGNAVTAEAAASTMEDLASTASQSADAIAAVQGDDRLPEVAEQRDSAAEMYRGIAQRATQSAEQIRAAGTDTSLLQPVFDDMVEIRQGIYDDDARVQMRISREVGPPNEVTSDKVQEIIDNYREKADALKDDSEGSEHSESGQEGQES